MSEMLIPNIDAYPILYTDVLQHSTENEHQVCRDDMWAVSTKTLNGMWADYRNLVDRVRDYRASRLVSAEQLKLSMPDEITIVGVTKVALAKELVNALLLDHMLEITTDAFDFNGTIGYTAHLKVLKP